MKFLPSICFTIMLAPLSAVSIEVYKSKKAAIDIHGHVSGAAFVGSQDKYELEGENVQPATSQFRADGILGINASMVLPNSYNVGVLADMELSSAIEVFYVYISGPFGELQFGQPENVSISTHLYNPEFLAPGIDTVDWSDFQFYGRSSVGSGLQTGDSSFLIYDNFAIKVNYLSPVIQGFQFAASWTPDPCANFDNSHTISLDGIGSCGEEDYIVQNVATFAAQFARKESFGLDWGISSSYIFGDKYTANKSPYGYNIGVKLNYASIEVGGSWQNSKNFNAANSEDKIWVLGFAYIQDDWRVGAAYRQSRRDYDSKADDRAAEGGTTMEIAAAAATVELVKNTNNEIEVGLAYDLGGGLWGSLSFEYVTDKAFGESGFKSYGGAFILTYQF